MTPIIPGNMRGNGSGFPASAPLPSCPLATRATAGTQGAQQDTLQGAELKMAVSNEQGGEKVQEKLQGKNKRLILHEMTPSRG